jgi:hypothetical protein
MSTMSKHPVSRGEQLLRHLRERELPRHPGAHLESPWPGHLDLAVKDETLAYRSVDGPPSTSCKLSPSSAVAPTRPNSPPTGYGLGESGWVTLDLRDHDLPPTDLLEAWIDESGRAQAPKTPVAELDGVGSVSSAPAAKVATGTKKPASESAAGESAASRKNAAARRKASE